MKNNRKTGFHPEAPVLKYHQESSNSCCLISLSSHFHSIGDNRAVTDIVNCIKQPLTLKKNTFRKIIDFANDIMNKKLRHIGEQHLIYNINKWKKKGAFDIINGIIENTLCNFGLFRSS